MKGFFSGLGAYSRAWKILSGRGFRWFLFFPLGILLLLFIGGNSLVSYAGNSMGVWVEDLVRNRVADVPALQWMGMLSGILIRLLLRTVYFFLFAAFGGYIVLVVMSPVYSWLSGCTEAYLGGKTYPFRWRQFFWEIFRGIGIALRNLVFQLLFSLLFFLCSFIPVVGWLAPPALFFLSAYFYGFSFVDYALERKRFNIRQSVNYVRKNKGWVTGIGTVFALVLMIPWIGGTLACFVSLLSVIAATVGVDSMGQPE